METNVSSDALLLERARQFDRQALAEIYDLFSPGLYRYAMRLVSDPQLAEECVAETFSRFLHALHARKGPRDFLQAYLYRVAHNWITDLYRREPPIDELESNQPDSRPDPETAAEHTLRDARLLEAIRQLTPDQQQVILLKFVEEWENETIAKSLKKPVGAIKSLQHRALARLQRLLNEELS
jgi:RNA polymerase sigma-70 factor, ECF subfamily